MKKVFIVYNWDTNEVACVTEDRGLAEEYMMDFFNADIEYQWYWEQQWRGLEIFDNLPAIAQQIWEDIIEWYEKYMIIYEEEVW